MRTPNAPARPYGRRLAFAYIALAAFVAVGVAAIQASPHSVVVQRYGPNLVTDALGILLTVVAVERLFSWQRDRAAAPIRVVALRRVWYQLNRLTHMLLFSYKAAAPSGSPEPASLDELLVAWQREGRHLDFRRPYGPDGPPRSWHRFGAEVATSFEDGIRDVIDRYLDVLGTELPVAAEDLIDHPVFVYLKHGADIERIDAEHGWDLPRQSFQVHSVEDPESDSLAEVAAIVSRIVAAYDRLGGRPLTLSAQMYDDHLSPAWGSGRYIPSSDPGEVA